MLTSAELILNGCAVRYTLRDSPRARRVSGWIRPETGLVVTLPRHAPTRQAEAFLIRNQRWVAHYLKRVARRSETLPTPWPYGASLLYRGESRAVEIRQARAGRVELVPGRLIVYAPSAGIEGARRVLQWWLKREAGVVLGERVRVLGARMGVQPKRIYVRRLRRSWGRCWPGGALSFNARLIMAPPSVLDYVVIHELAHLTERSHAPRFWALVAEHDPAHREARAWLRTFGRWLGV
jgi:predicted metal-dependent hydrolase